MITRRRTTAADLREELRRFEALYGVPSERMTDAFLENGELRETPQLARWSLIYSAYQRVCGIPTPA